MTDTNRRTVMKAMGGGLFGISVLGGVSAAEPDQDMFAANFAAAPSPDHVVTEDGTYRPVPNTEVRGNATFQYRAKTGIFYRIQVENAGRVTGIHIHEGTTEENGPVLVRLHEAERPIERVAPLGTELEFPVEDWILRADPRLTDPVADVEGVAELMHDGTTYVQITTETGLLRGQIRRE